MEGDKLNLILNDKCKQRKTNTYFHRQYKKAIDVS